MKQTDGSFWASGVVGFMLHTGSGSRRHPLHVNGAASCTARLGGARRTPGLTRAPVAEAQGWHRDGTGSETKLFVLSC